MATILLSILAFLFWHGVQGADFTPGSPTDGTTLRACVGMNFSLPWKVNLLQGEEMQYTEWWFSFGSASQRIAFLSGTGKFNPSLNFAQKVSFIPNAGLLLHNVTKGSAGNYGVGMNYLIPDGIPFDIGRSLTLKVDC